ncbi:xylulokinase [Botrimarina hoheduenensis]|uniref:Xylulose kinase n=1 Tax=Botrimarina hoheduenensis TaxID=2528000 RepID=A0A5C5WFV2_9BACT|nr:xylulokinase [Botrimarina hoheduenensis]TWT48642.1 Xylulose kinase [Botrimarina hoheduenensis]
MSIYLGIDIGTSGAKTLAIDPTGKVLASASAAYGCHHPRPLWSEQDPDLWWGGVVQTVRQVMKTAKLKPGAVKGIGLSGQMHGSVFLDKSGNVLRPALLWNDQRTVAECAEIERLAGGRKRLIKMVANPALTGFQAPKILWLRNNEPRHYERLTQVLLPKDDVRRRLTGELATEVSDASGTLLLDVAKRQWSKPLLSKLGLDASLLPRCVESEEPTGTLTPQAAAELGLSTDCVVVGGAGDCAAGAVGNGVVKRGVIATSLGTSGVVFAHSDTPEVDPLGRVHTFCHAVRGKWHQMGVTLTAAGALQWFADTLCQADQAALRPSENLFEKLLVEASTAPAGAEGLYFLPYLAGERTPHADPNARGAFVGLTLKHNRGAMIRALVEGVTYALRDSLDILRELGVPMKEIRTTGGGAKSPFWRQLQADVLGVKVAAMQQDQGPAMGVALLAAVGCGEYRSIEQACSAAVSTTEPTKPVRQTKLIYDAGVATYRELYRQLSPTFNAIAAKATAKG